ncbi:MAG: ribosome small subunit-dependent GTPase A [Bacteroidales bacterium]|jgi:ribosome biogenesis GTPase|nr:ribosome small subunit-dependent GTPase A [Bacteroidales bacterium]
MASGLVIKNTGNIYDVMDESGVVRQCKVRGIFRLKGLRTTNPVAVGDHVEFDADSQNDFYWITAVGERKNCLLRKSVNLSKQTHIIATNIDLAVVVASMHEPRTPLGFIDRTLILCEAYNVPACIVFNKTDIYPQKAMTAAVDARAMYEGAGYKVFFTSAQTGEGIESLRNAVARKVCLFTGNSGVGKSAILNVIDPTLNLKTSEVSSFNEKGKHTTTFAQMFPVAGGFLMDTPGMKEFGMIKINTEELSQYFPEMARLSHECAYSNCTHTHEPNCAVKAAVEAGKINSIRYRSYVNILSGEEVSVPSLLENKQEKK